MANTYTITVINQSGTTQSYVLFNALPSVSPTIESQVFNNAIKVIPVGPGYKAEFIITEQFYGYVGLSDGIPGADSVAVIESGSNPVTLGSEDSTGTIQPGTILQMNVIEGAPQFTSSATGDIPLGAFGIDTAPGDSSNNFTYENALAKNWVIGLGKTVNGGSAEAAATITPQPNCNYQIQPSNTWYVTFDSYQQGQICTIEAEGASTASIDFTNMTNATVIHDEEGKLTVQSV